MTNGHDPVDAQERPGKLPYQGDHRGLTKREYFAAAALQGMLTREGQFIDRAHINAVKAADLLITELNKGERK